MKDKTVDYQEAFSLARAYLCTGSSAWLNVTDSDRSDVKPVKWVSKRYFLKEVDVKSNEIFLTLGFKTNQF